MAVYMLHVDGEPGEIKIGYTTDVARRAMMLRTMTWKDIVILRVMPGGRNAETWLHDHYKHLHIAREWFKFDPGMLTVVPSLEPGAAIARRPHNSYANRSLPTAPVGYHADVIRTLGGTTKIAAALGLTKSVLTKWAVRGIPSVHWHKLIKMAADAEPALVFTAADLERTKPETIRNEAAA